MISFESNRSVGKEYALLLSIHRRRRKNKAFKHQSRYFPLQSIVFSASQRSSALTHRKKVPQFALYRRRQAVEKECCVLSSTKVRFLFRNSAIFEKKKLRKEEILSHSTKTSGLFYESHLVSSIFSRVFSESQLLLRDWCFSRSRRYA